MDRSGPRHIIYVNLRRGAHLTQNIPHILRYILNYFNDIGLEVCHKYLIDPRMWGSEVNIAPHMCSPQPLIKVGNKNTSSV